MGTKMKWFEVKERSAGEKRLVLTYFCYKCLGKFSVEIIAFFVALVTFLKAKDLRRCSEKYLAIVGVKPSFINVFKHFLSYAMSLADKIEVFAGGFDMKKIRPDSGAQKFLESKSSEKGAVCIFSHIGNIDVARALIDKNRKITIVLSLVQAKIFREFLKKLSFQKNITLSPVEDMGVATAFLLKEKLENGEYVFIAGDRTSKNAKNIDVEILNRRAEFPLGTFKLAELAEVPVYFVSCLKSKKFYDFEVREFQVIEKCAVKMAQRFADFVSEQIQKAPFQFYHFYDFFKE